MASSLAIVAGELLSPARWYWAVIAAFVIYSGTTSRGETLIKGRQRVAGTVAGVGLGTVVASLVAGNVTVSLCLIFVSLFAGFYLMKVSYVFMVIGTTTMLALLYGLLGEFTIGLLVTRIEETAIGAAIGITAALVVLPTSTRSTVGNDIRSFVTALGDLVSLAGENITAASGEDITDQARDLDRLLAAIQTSAKPLTTGVFRLQGRGSVRRWLAVLLACDHYARGLTRVITGPADPATQDHLRRATGHVKANLDHLAAILDHDHPDVPRSGALHSGEDLFDDVQAAIDIDTRPIGARQQLTVALRYLRKIDLAVVGLSRDLAVTP